MGYYTHFSGTITLQDKKAESIIKYLLKEEIEPFTEVQEVIMVGEGEVEFGGDGKYYDGEIEDICYFIKLLDKDAEGEIRCEGEDNSDNWKIVLDKDCVEILRGEVVYTNEGRYIPDKKILKQANKFLKDKSISKKILLSELEEG